MINRELVKQVKQIELHARFIAESMTVGAYKSAFKGQGESFTDLRHYTASDDPRRIDWHTFARTKELSVRQYEEEREQTVWLLVDCSASIAAGLNGTQQQQRLAEFSALIAASAGLNSDKVGLLLFSDQPKKIIPPRKGRKHLLKIIHQLLSFTAVGKTDVAMILEEIANLTPKRSIIFLVSDFIDSDFNKPFKHIALRHDLIPVVMQPAELQGLAGITNIKSAEDSSEILIRNSSGRDWFTKQATEIEQLSKRYNCDCLVYNANEELLPPLLKLFKQRYRQGLRHHRKR